MLKSERAAPFIGEPVPEVLARPKCPYCAKRLRPVIVTRYGTKEVPRHEYRRQATGKGTTRMVSMPTGETETVPGAATSREWLGRWHAYGAFCTLRCACDFANAAHAAGYRIKGK
jgi:hypothetical protein